MHIKHLMTSNFPFKDVIIRKVLETSKVNIPLYADDYWQMNRDEFAMQVEGIGDFYARNGNEIEYAPFAGSSDESVQLYLNGSVYGAILHQRQILPMHGSCIALSGSGVMFCGESGAGKSALTAAFSMNDCFFLTDDVTPVVFKDDLPHILALSDRIKLWDDTIEQLRLDKSELKRISPETDKYYFRFDKSNIDKVPLNIIFLLEIHDQQSTIINELTGSERFSSLYNEIYRHEYLKGKPENEMIYFRNLVDISNNVKIYRVKRSAKVKVNDMMTLLREHIINSLSITPGLSQGVFSRIV
jgi:hypothetical protein